MSQYQSQNENRNDNSWLEEDLEDHVPISEYLEDKINIQLDEYQDNKKKNNTKKIFTFVGIGLAAFFGIVAIFNGINNDYDYESNDYSTEISGDPFLFSENNSFELDDISYTLPIKVNDLTANGWNLIIDNSGEETEYVSEYDSVDVSFYKDGKEFSASLDSFSNKSVPIEDAYVKSLSINDRRTPDFVGPLDLKIGMDINEARDNIENSGYECELYNSSYSSYEYYSYYFNDNDSDDIYYSYDINIDNDGVESLYIYYRDYSVD